MLFLVPHIEFKETTGNYTQETVTQSQMDGEPQQDAIEDVGDYQNRDYTEQNTPGLRLLGTDVANSSVDVILSPRKSDVSNTPAQTPVSKKTQPISNSKPSRNITTDDKLLAAITKEDDPDEQFMLSCVPALRRLNPRKNMIARMQIQNILFQLEFGNSNDFSAPSGHGSTPLTQCTPRNDEESLQSFPPAHLNSENSSSHHSHNMNQNQYIVPEHIDAGENSLEHHSITMNDKQYTILQSPLSSFPSQLL